MLADLRKRITSTPWFYPARAFLTLPHYEGARLTPKRVFNLYLMRYHRLRGHTNLLSYPTRLTVESTNVCNLGCLGCFTGLGEVGRKRSTMPLDLYRKLLDEIGDYLFEIELYNWGEPLLNRELETMIADAARRGIGTMVSTNFSFPIDEPRAERLVSSGLTALGVSLDGASQETYEQYRVRGKFETVLENCRLINAAKKKQGTTTPRMIWEFHTFEHNVDDVERAKAMANDLNMDIGITKGWVIGPDWEAKDKIAREIDGKLGQARGHFFPCPTLWEKAVVNNDGGAAPCCGAFYQEDDFGRLKISSDNVGSSSFKEVWNGWRYQEARRLFRSRTGSDATRSLICFDCPATIMREQFKRHVAAGKNPKLFKRTYSYNDGFNYFFNRKRFHQADAIELRPVGAEPRSDRT